MTDFEHERLDVYRAAIEWLVLTAMVLRLGGSESGSGSGSGSGSNL